MLYVKGFLVALQGVPVTVGVTLIAMVTGVVLGLVLALMKMSRIKVLTALASLYIEIIRGTPLIVQALIMAYGLPQLLQSSGISFRWPYLIIPAVIVCGLNSAAYVAEVIRSGIQAVDKGQMEAARSIREDFLHQNSFHEIDTYTSLRKQFLMMKLVLAFYEESQKALNDGASSGGLIKMAVRERIGRFKYTTEDKIETEYQAVLEQLAKEIADVLGKEDF